MNQILKLAYIKDLNNNGMKLSLFAFGWGAGVHLRPTKAKQTNGMKPFRVSAAQIHQLSLLFSLVKAKKKLS